MGWLYMSFMRGHKTPKRRIRSIMTQRMAELSLLRKIMLAIFVFAVVAVPMALGIVRVIPICRQILHASGPLPSFEVASIRPWSATRALKFCLSFSWRVANRRKCLSWEKHLSMRLRFR